ncbi:4-alpha-glucanotransferase [Massilia sp. TS11]|uniref:4-alpha-glucanotransferase n=1 Tax=Massilia sp. TS11 TaxID=2908003 RepID=UPI001EDB4814|nr:4-alpha-glucanotransferase [Massilia sp. TS11]MCG2583733.1 4-alpha-glucanotransferase [Massilia sp. TS11]
MKRASGIVLHPTSLPGRYGIGDLGAAAYRFVDWLAAGHQKIWQLLPLGPTSYGDSPYQCLSSMAGNTLLISLDHLQEQGFLDSADLAEVPPFPTEAVDYGWVIPWKKALLAKAHGAFVAKATPGQKSAYEAFCKRQDYWLEDYARFCAIKDAHDGRAWTEWTPELRARCQPQLNDWAAAHGSAIDLHRWLQFVFFSQWGQLKRYANAKGVEVMGDIPIFVAFDSADTWSHQDEFYLNADGNPSVVAGVPPDYFSATGQRWGNPLYRWDVMQANGYAWWKDRIRALLAQVDIIRIDHFRGFEAYWEIPASEPTAVHGRWVKGPGIDLFNAIKAEFGEIPIVVEDLGVITEEVNALRDGAGFPGMKIFQFGFSENNPSFLARNYIPHSIAYTGTHDNNTTRGWFKTIPQHERDHVCHYFGRGFNEDEITPVMIEALWQSPANTVLAPMQDALNLGEEARMNFPGKMGGNWAWRYREEQLTPELAQWFAGITDAAGR